MIGITNNEFFNQVKYNKLYSNLKLYKVKVIDYDGSIIDAQNLTSGQEYTLPQAPSHEGLVFQGWSSSQAIVNNKITLSDNNVMIGAIYTTSSGQNEFDIELTKRSYHGLTIEFNMDGTKDWGDGTSNTSTTHTYSDYGEYTIKCNGTTILTGFGLFGQSESNVDFSLKNIRLATANVADCAFQSCYSLRNITLSNNVTSIGVSAFEYTTIKNIILPSNTTKIDSHAFAYCRSLKDIVIPNNLINIYDNAFSYCFALSNIVIPNNITSIGGYAFSRCYSLLELKLPNISTFNNYTCSYLYSLKTLKIPNNITSISTNAFNSNYSTIEYDFSQHTTIPVLSNTNAFNGINKICKIKVPFNLYTQWINETNWSTYADYIDGGDSATINFIVTSGNPDIYVNNNLISGTTINIWGTSINYYAFDSSSNTLLPTQTLTGITEGSTQNVNINLTNASTITLNTGVSGMNVVFTIDGNNYNATENNGNYSINVVGSNIEIDYTVSKTGYIMKSGTITTTGSNITVNLNYSKITLSTGVSGLNASFIINNISTDAIDDSGNYYLYIPGSGESIEYYINGGSNYMDDSGTITTTGSNITQNITLISALSSTFTRPNLTANGTLGDNAFAVSAVAYSTSASYQAWKAVDNNSTSTYWYSKSGGGEYIFYNPDVLNVTQLTHKYSSTLYRAKEINIKGSNDGTNWQDVESTYSGSSTTYTSTLTNTKYYKYYKLAYIPNSSYIRLADLAITATKKVPV